MSDPNGAVKNKQTTIVVVSLLVSVVLVILGMFFFDTAPKPSSEKPPAVAITPPGSVDDKDAWRTQQAAQEANNASELNSLKQMLQDQQTKQEKLQDEVNKQRLAPEQGGGKSDSAVLSQPLPVGSQGRDLDPPFASKTGMQPGLPVPLNTPINQQLPEAPKREVEVIQFSNPTPPSGGFKSNEQSKAEVLGFPVNKEAEKVSYTTPPEPKNTVEFLPADSFVRVAMLNGVDAPTGGQVESDPLPITLHVLDTANLANKYKLNIKDCRFLAGAWGDLNSQRTMARLVNMTCIIDGQTVELPVKGVLMGEDGKVGVRGRLVTKQGQLIANSLLSGFAGAVGQAFSQSATTTSISPLGATATVTPGQAWKAGVGGGLSSTGNALQQYFLKAADKMFPVIETDSGRVIEVLITKGVEYTLGPKDNGDTYRDLLTRNGIPNRSENDDD
jgi:conjugal transfer pilus assembly protein TraB